MHERISKAVAAWLAHPTGAVQGVAFTALFFVPTIFGWKLTGALFWYLSVCTFISFETQFTLAYQNRLAEQKLNAALATIDRIVDDLYVASQTLLQMARSESDAQDVLVAQTAAVAAQTDAIVAALRELQARGDSPD